MAAPAPGQAAPSVTNGIPFGHTPAQIAQAYGFNQVAFTNGVKGTGAGQTIAIVDAYVDPNMASDLAKFDAQFGLAAPPSFSQFVEQGATRNSGWALETALDVEWAHGDGPEGQHRPGRGQQQLALEPVVGRQLCPHLANVSVVSMSWGAGEFASETAYDSYFTTPAGHIGITFVASSGDAGAGTTWPSVSPNVLAVGGTTLYTNPSGTYVGETAWSGSGGGVSSFETVPSYQTSVQSSGKRTTPDVAFNADPNTGFAVYDSVAYAGQNGWFEVGGTSAGAPQWAALIAIANQGRAISGLGSLSNAQSTLYALPAGDFHDITSGSNGFATTAGYDLVTGRGSPVANSIVQALSGRSPSTSQTANAQTTATMTTTSKSHSTQSSPSSPSSPVKTPSTRSVLTPAAVIQPDVLPAVINDASRVAPDPTSLNAYIPQVADRFAPLTSAATTGTLASTANEPAAFAPTIAPTLRTPSLVADLGPSPVGSATALPTIAGGLSQFGLAEVSEDLAVAEALRPADIAAIAEAVGSIGSDLAAGVSSDAISHSAIDALFATNGWLTQATSSVDSPTTSSSMGKTAVAGIAGSLGLAGLVAAIRRRRRQAAAR